MYLPFIYWGTRKMTIEWIWIVGTPYMLNLGLDFISWYPLAHTVRRESGQCFPSLVSGSVQIQPSSKDLYIPLEYTVTELNRSMSHWERTRIITTFKTCCAIASYFPRGLLSFNLWILNVKIGSGVEAEQVNITLHGGDWTFLFTCILLCYPSLLVLDTPYLLTVNLWELGPLAIISTLLPLW